MKRGTAVLVKSVLESFDRVPWENHSVAYFMRIKTNSELMKDIDIVYNAANRDKQYDNMMKRACKAMLKNVI